MKSLLSLSIDVDNKWSYLKTRGDDSWRRYPSYLDEFVPIALDRLGAHGIKATFFIVGADAARPENATALRSIAGAGHEIGNHSFHHEPWLHTQPIDEIRAELEAAEQAIHEATGHRPIGFRGPGYAFSPSILEVLVERGYRYDASSLPTFLGPLARLYYFARSPLMSKDERARRKELFGKLSHAFRRLRPYSIDVPSGQILEIPVTTMPFARVPFHLSYLLYLSTFSRALSKAYLATAIAALKLTGVEPSFLVHPLDLLGNDRVSGLDFFPAMGISTTAKLDFFDAVIDRLKRSFRIVPMAEHARKILGAERPDRELVAGSEAVGTEPPG